MIRKAMKRNMKPPVIEFSLSIMSIWLSIVFISRPDILDDVPLFFQPLANHTTPSFWGGVFICIALMKIVGFIAEKTYLRKMGLMFSTFLYALMSAGYYLGAGANSIGFGFFAVISYMALTTLREVTNDG